MKYILYLGIIIFLLTSCNSHEKFPEFVTSKMAPENVEPIGINKSFVKPSSEEGLGQGSFFELDSLEMFQRMYYQKDETFDVSNFQELWNSFRKKTIEFELSIRNASRWYEFTGFLFQLTGDAFVAEELEKIAWSMPLISDSVSLDSIVAPYIFTRYVDHIHVNLFNTAKVSYSHSMGGNVSIRQETSYPASGSVRLFFHVDTKQYVEIFVRIPSWAEGATVTVKQVKYLATPGRYTKIAKKWKEGDVVEIEFPLNNLPEYLIPTF